MGWASGSQLMFEVIAAVKPVVNDKATRIELYKKLIDAFEGQDCDTLCECQGADPAFDKALRAAHPDWDWTEP